MSKTVKRVSRKVKRVMTVLMIGLVAMLATKAQAHSKYIKPIGVWYCPPSICVGVHTDQNTPMDSSHIEINEVFLNEIIAEGPCKDGSNPSVPSLFVRKETDSITHLIDKGVLKSIGTVVAIFADSVVSKYSRCRDGSTPDVVLFRKFSVIFTPMIEKEAGACARVEDKENKCSAIGGETVRAAICTLDASYKLTNFPPPNVFYDCAQQ